jgi:hypothetical protein
MQVSGTGTGKKSRSKLIAIVAVVAALVIGLVVFIGAMKKTQAGYVQEHDLTSAYDKNRNKLSECIDIVVMAAGFTKEQAEQMNKALIAAHGGELAGGLSSSSVTPAGFAAIITTAQPDLAQYSKAFERGYADSIGCRKDFTGFQSNLIGKAKTYKDWKSNPFNFSAWFKTWPSDELEANNGTDVVKGAAALERITNIITTSGTRDAYKDGTYNAPNPFETKAPTSTPALASSAHATR